MPVRHKETGVRVDLTFSETMFEDSAISRGRKISVDGVSVNFITPEDLVVQKIFAGRPKDLMDVEGIVSIHRTTLDFSMIEANIKAFDTDLGQTDLWKLWNTIINRI